MLMLLVLVGLPPSDAQTQGPGPSEVPSELWKEYPLEKPDSAAQEKSAERQSRRPPAARPVDRETSDGGHDATALVFMGLLLVAASAVLVLAARSGVIQRLRREEHPPRGAAAGAPQVAGGQPAPKGHSATSGGRFQQAIRRVSTASDRSQAPPVVSSRTQSPGVAEPAPAHDVASTAWDSPGDTSPPPVPVPTSVPSRVASGLDAPAHSAPTTQSALGYASVPAEEKANGAMRRQQREIEHICGRKGLALLKLVRDIESRAGSDLSRPGLAYVLERLAAHDASCLVVASLERLTRSAANLGTLVEWLDRSGARLVVVDIDLDTATPEGRLGAKALAAVGGSERKTLRQRTSKGLEAARLAQKSSGQPAVRDRPALSRRIAQMRASGMTLQAIADTLNAEGIPTLRGGIEWRPSSVQAAVGYKRPNRKGRLA